VYLSDKDIKAAIQKGSITIQNFDQDRLQPASYDILLGKEFLIFKNHSLDCLDPKIPAKNYMKKITLEGKEDFFILHPHQLALGVSKDRIGVDAKHCYNLMGKSSLGRLGLIIHATAGFIDPGNDLNVTLELYNTNAVPMKLYPNMKIGQVAFFELNSKCERPYGHKDLNSKYYKHTKVEASRMHLNFGDSE
jgi:dCTP deaminase